METKILTLSELSDLIYNGKNLPNEDYSKDLDNIRFFSFDDFNMYCYIFNEKYVETLRYVVTYDKKHIYGILKFAYFRGSGGSYSISYCSTNNNYMNKGICKNLVKCFVHYFKNEYPNEMLCISQYTVSGWKYLRNSILNYCVQLNIKFRDSIVGYFDKGKEYDSEYYTLRDLSIKINGYVNDF